MKTRTKFIAMAMVAIFSALSLTACNKFKQKQFSYVGIIDDKTVFLDNDNGKVLYVGNNRIVSSIDLNSNTNEINTIKNFEIISSSRNRFGLLQYTYKLSTRFYNNQMLYQLNIKAENLDIKILGEKVKDITEMEKLINETKRKIIFIDKDKFELESFIPQTSGNFSLVADYEPIISDGEGSYQGGNKTSEFYNLKTQGRIPITFENYMEIDNIKIEVIHPYPSSLQDRD